MFLKEGMSLVAEARLHLVVSIQTLQGGPCDVHLAESTSRAEDARQLVIKVWQSGLKSLYPSLFSSASQPLGLLRIIHSKEIYIQTTHLIW